MSPQSTAQPTALSTDRVALIVRPDGQATLTPYPVNPVAALVVVTELLGTGVTAISTPGSDWVAYADADPDPEETPPNPVADYIARTLGRTRIPDDYLRGIVIFLGRSGAEEVGCPDHVIDLARRVGALKQIPRQAQPEAT